jgi:integrase/recombinase XerC
MSEPTLDNIARSFERHLRAENKSPKTVTTYMEAVTQLAGILGQDGRTLADARRGDVETFITDLLERRTAATASNRYRALKVFYAWMEDEGEVAESPMRRMKPPAVPDQPVDVLTEDHLRRLLAVCAGRDFAARRDTALIMLLLDSGGRLTEIAEMHVIDVDFDAVA